MTEIDATMKQRLLDERGRIVDELAAMGVDSDIGGIQIEADEGFADSAASTAEKAELLALVERLRETLADLDDALGRIDDGTYGRCEVCGNDIPAPRLEARPQARLCLDCQERS